MKIQTLMSVILQNSRLGPVSVFCCKWCLDLSNKFIDHFLLYTA